MKEEWKSIEGYEELYRVSNFGRILSIGRDVPTKNTRNPGGTYKHKEQLLKPKIDSETSYCRVMLYVEGGVRGVTRYTPVSSTSLYS